MKTITLLCSGISSIVLYLAMFVMVVISVSHGAIGFIFEKITDCLDYYLGDQLNVFNEALNGKIND